MSSPRYVRQQEKTGIRAGKRVKGELVPLSAIRDGAGGLSPLYIVNHAQLPNQPPPPLEYFCPGCGDGVLGGGGIMGPNNKRRYECPVCGMSWTSQDSMPAGIGLIVE